MTKNEKEIYDLLLKEAGEEQLVEETNANNSTTQICEEQNYNFKAGYEMPRDFQCAGDLSRSLAYYNVSPVAPCFCI